MCTLMKDFHFIKPDDFCKSPFQTIGKDWMLVTAGNKEKANTMTASWGGLGIMWGKPVAFIVIRPQRYTKEFMDKESRLSLSFLANQYRKQLNYLGTVSGRDEDKITNSGLTLAFEEEIPYFTESSTVMFGKLLYQQEMKPSCFLTPELDEKWYANKDYHTLYIAEITSIYSK